ncbi:hypothetical protein M2266_002454 [Streptomyces sp. SPB162]|nr:hypothetical protein [Streptomyces sp. SPB162]
MAPWISTPSKPASIALPAAVAKSAMVARISASSSSRGAMNSFGPSWVYTTPSAATGEAPTGTSPSGSRSGWPIRPACISWAKILPPAACTASVTVRQAAICSALCSPGVSG